MQGAHAESEQGGRAVVEATSTLRSLDLAARIGEYEARDAVWADGQPLVVGRDFDFALVGGLPAGVGAGLAAAKRQRENLELAQRIAQQPRLDVESLFDVLLRTCADCRPLVVGKRFVIYGILYGSETARLSVVVELREPQTSAATYIAVSAAGAASDLVEPGKLRAAFEAGLTAVANMMRSRSSSAALTEHAEPELGACARGGSATSRGRVIARDDLAVELVAAEKWGAHLRCPLEAFRQAPTPSPAPDQGR